MAQVNPSLSQMSKSLGAHNTLLLPVTGGGGNLLPGTILIPGATAATNMGVAIQGGVDAGATGKAIIGVLGEKHVYATTGDALTQTLGNWFPGFGTQNVPSHNVDLLDTTTLLRISYDLSSTLALNTITNSTTYCVAGTLEASGADEGGFFYVNGGTAIGQIGFIKGSVTGSGNSGYFVLPSALTTLAVSGDTIVKILPFFYKLPLFTAATANSVQKLGSQAAAGSGAGTILGNSISINGIETIMDPKAYHNYQKLNLVSVLDIYAQVAVPNTIFHSNS